MERNISISWGYPQSKSWKPMHLQPIYRTVQQPAGEKKAGGSGLSGTAGADGYTVDGMPLNLSDKDQKWPGIKDPLSST